MGPALEHPDGSPNSETGLGTKSDEFAEQAAEYALFQRTDLLPRRRYGGVFRLVDKFGLRQSWGSFVRSYAAGHAEKILHDYGREMRAEFDRRIAFIPSSACSILDIGCGLAGIDLHLYEYLRGNDPHLYLLDRTHIEDRVWYMYEANGAFYNSLELAKMNLVRNGVPEDRIRCLEAPDDGIINGTVRPVDLVVSTISWGFHYPISTYLQSVGQIMSSGGVLLVDVRRGTDGLEQLERQFPRSTEVVDEGEKHLVVKCVKAQSAD
jgi:SAM-dependent methyltransferase